MHVLIEIPLPQSKKELQFFFRNNEIPDQIFTGHVWILWSIKKTDISEKDLEQSYQKLNDKVENWSKKMLAWYFMTKKRCNT